MTQMKVNYATLKGLRYVTLAELSCITLKELYYAKGIMLR